EPDSLTPKHLSVRLGVVLGKAHILAEGERPRTRELEPPSRQRTVRGERGGTCRKAQHRTTVLVPSGLKRSLDDVGNLLTRILSAAGDDDARGHAVTSDQHEGTTLRRKDTSNDNTRDLEHAP